MATKITDLRSALAPLADVRKRRPVEIDLEKVATAVIDAQDVVSKSDDGDAVLTSIEKTVGEIDAFLDTVTHDEATDTLLAPGSDVAKGFAVDTDKAKKSGGKPPWLDDKIQEEEDPEAKKKKAAAKAAAEGKAPAEGAVDTAKGDDDKWPEDMSSDRDRSVSREARLTKGQRQRTSSRETRVAKRADRRDEAKARARAGVAPGERGLS